MYDIVEWVECEWRGSVIEGADAIYCPCCCNKIIKETINENNN